MKSTCYEAKIFIYISEDVCDIPLHVVVILDQLVYMQRKFANVLLQVLDPNLKFFLHT